MFLQKHLSRTSGARRSSMHNKSNHSSKVALQELQEELMSAKVRETKLISQNADTKQKLMELETTVSIKIFSQFQLSFRFWITPIVIL